MADKKITDLTLKDDLDAGDSFPIDNGVQTYRATGGKILAYIESALEVTSAMLADTFVSALATVTGTGADYIMISDTSDAGKPKKALVSQLVQIDSELYLEGGNGHGAVNVCIRRFTAAAKDVGTAMSYVDDSANGMSVTINEDGVYTMGYGDRYSVTTTYIAFSVNASGGSLAIAPEGQTYAQGRRAGAPTSAANNPTETTWTGRLTAGDIVRAHDEGLCDATDQNTYFYMTQVSK